MKRFIPQDESDRCLLAEPSKDLAQGFIPMKVQLKIGKTLFGVILSQSADGFDLVNADGNREPIKESDVKTKVETTPPSCPKAWLTP
jgi:hypothetical protein